jgi:hypothetical protein
MPDFPDVDNDKRDDRLYGSNNDPRDKDHSGIDDTVEKNIRYAAFRKQQEENNKQPKTEQKRTSIDDNVDFLRSAAKFFAYAGAFGLGVIVIGAAATFWPVALGIGMAVAGAVAYKTYQYVSNSKKQAQNAHDINSQNQNPGTSTNKNQDTNREHSKDREMEQHGKQTAYVPPYTERSASKKDKGVVVVQRDNSVSSKLFSPPKPKTNMREPTM